MNTKAIHSLFIIYAVYSFLYEVYFSYKGASISNTTVSYWPEIKYKINRPELVYLYNVYAYAHYVKDIADEDGGCSPKQV